MDTNYNQQQMDSEQVHHILTIEDPSFVRKIQLDAATYSIGRHSSNDIVLSCQKTSRNHATLLRRTDAKTNQCSYWILDGDLEGNRSRNGIYINGKKGLVHELQSGDVVHFSGDAAVKYKTSLAPLENQLQSKNSPDLTTVDNAVEQHPLPEQETIIAPKLNNSDRTSKYSNLAQTSLADSSPQPIIEIDLYGNITYINSAGLIDFQDIHHQKLDHPLLENLIALDKQGHDRSICREITVGGKIFRQTAYYLPEQKIIRNYLTEITLEKALEKELQQTKFLYNTVTRQVFEAIILIESATKQVIEVNSVCADLLGYSHAELLQMNIYELVSESEKFASALRRIIAEKKSFEGEYLLRHHNGNTLQTQVQISLIGFGSTEKICFAIRNNSTDKSQARSLTLYKRELFDRQLLTAIANAQRSQKLLAVMFCKIDFLDDLNLVMGTEQSERLLLAMEKRLGSCIRAGDSVVRWQEDKFALLMPQVSELEEIIKIGQRIESSLERSFTLGAIQATIQSAAGIAVYPQDGTDPEILLASANTALERACQNNNSYQFYDDAMNSQALVAIELEDLLQQALNKEEFQLYYQPQINLNTEKIEAIEALLRWEHPELGLVAPGNFIRLAEKTRLIVPIGEWTILTACKQNKAWQTQELPSSKVIVSLSLIQFQQPNLAQKVAEILAETGLDAGLLELEISAATLMDNIDHSRHIINQLKALGVKIAVDRFTTGFLALEYLKQISIDTLKIDRSLVQQLTNSPQDVAIVTALIELGKGFNLKIVAEGVETQEQVELLRGLNCHQMQGFWFGRPLAADEASKLLELNDSEEASMTKSANLAVPEVDEDRESDLNNHDADGEE